MCLAAQRDTCAPLQAGRAFRSTWWSGENLARHSPVMQLSSRVNLCMAVSSRPWSLRFLTCKMGTKVALSLLACLQGLRAQTVKTVSTDAPFPCGKGVEWRHLEPDRRADSERGRGSGVLRKPWFHLPRPPWALVLLAPGLTVLWALACLPLSFQHQARLVVSFNLFHR